MNPLTSVKGTIISGFVLAILVAFYVSPESSAFSDVILVFGSMLFLGYLDWSLYYFNFVQVPAMADALADEGGPGPAAIGKVCCTKSASLVSYGCSCYMAYRCMGLSISPQYGFMQTFLFQAPAGPMMSLGAWMGTIMLFNVWVLIWPNQKKVLGIVEASADEIAKAKFTAAMASRTNVVLSVPMLLCMIGAGHGGYLF